EKVTILSVRTSIGAAAVVCFLFSIPLPTARLTAMAFSAATKMAISIIKRISLVDVFTGDPIDFAPVSDCKTSWWPNDVGPSFFLQALLTSEHEYLIS